MSSRGQGNPFFTPTQISNCQLWLDAADTTTLTFNGSNVTRWRDKSGKGFTATNSGSITTTKLNGLNVLNMPQTQMVIQNFSQNVYSTTFFVANAQTAFFILALGNYSSYVFVYNFDLYYFNAGAQNIQLRDSVNGSGTPVVSANTYFLFSIGYGGGSSTSVYNVNGTPRNTVVTGGAAMTDTTLTNTLYINGNQSGSIKDNTLFCELLIYNGALTQAQAQQVEGYLAWKWGLQANLPANHPYKSSPIPPLLSPPTSLPLSITNTFFTPNQIPNLQVWFDAADSNTFTYTAGRSILRWRDKSSNAYFVFQSNTSLQPFLSPGIQNSLGGVQFAQNTYLYQLATSMPNFTTGGSTSVLIVARNGTVNTGWNLVNTMWFDANGTNATQRYHFSFNQATTKGTALYTNGGFVGVVTSNAVSASSNAILGFTTSPSFQTIHTNGSTDTYAGTTLPNAVGSTAFIFNDPRNDPGTSANIVIFEMVGYNTQITTAQRQQLEGYMAWKWGLQGSLPATHPYKSSPIAPLVNPPTALPQGIARSWLPTQIPGCQLWLDAADTATISGGNPVVSWQDKSGTSRTTTFVGSSNIYNPSARSVITNNGNTSYFYANVNLKKSQVQYANVFIVYTWNGASQTGTNQALWGQDIGGGWNRFQLLGFTAIPSYAYGFSYTPDSPNYTTVSSLNTPNRLLYTAVYSYQVTNGSFVNVNGSLASARVTEAPSSPETTTTNTYFGSIDTGYAGTVGFHEILIYTTSLTDIQRQTVEGYLAWKWGLQGNLPANHPFAKWPPSP